MKRGGRESIKSHLCSAHAPRHSRSKSAQLHQCLSQSTTARSSARPAGRRRAHRRGCQTSRGRHLLSQLGSCSSPADTCDCNVHFRQGCTREFPEKKEHAKCNSPPVANLPSTENNWLRYLQTIFFSRFCWQSNRTRTIHLDPVAACLTARLDQRNVAEDHRESRRRMVRDHDPGHGRA